MNALRGSRIGGVSYEADTDKDLAPRQVTRFACPRGHEFGVIFAVDAEPQDTWICRKHGVTAVIVDGKPAEQQAKPGRTPWDMLRERRTISDLEELLDERLALLRQRRELDSEVT
ncbi:RNA polymerase-binding protein RbpA [Allokutzneria multivorans]|uniref:RNA polymerase-binding protein RbpA n=1 Tax=Allokutzneria multivorans TaxID=1142134 RepID=A0ABP7RD76_9PSEU